MIAWHWPEIDGVKPLEIEIEPWLSEQARNEFLTRFSSLALSQKLSI